jgi:ATP-binding cassette subfamily F protein uup
MRLLMGEPNVLLLDEPTNDLDIDTLTALEDLLDGWPGTLVVVSHDRYLTERVCDRAVALFGDGRITDLPGGIDEYLTRRSAARSEPARGVAGRAVEPQGERQGLSAAEWRATTKELGRIERRLEAVQTRQAELHDALAAAATDPERLMQLNTELKSLLAEKDELEQRWLETSESME